MGCASSVNPEGIPRRLQTVTGQLKLTVNNATIFNNVSALKMDPYVTLKLSNQVQTSKVIQNGHLSPTFNQTFIFFINSCYKIHGRNLQVSLYDKKKILSDGDIGYGIIDLDNIINNKKLKQQLKCHVNWDKKLAGYVNITAQFIQQQFKIISFRIQKADIERKTSTFGNMKCKIQLTIGQQVLTTSQCQDTQQYYPIWDKDILTFKCPLGIRQGQLKLLDGQKQIAKCMLNIQSILKNNGQTSYTQKLQYQRKNAAQIKFQTYLGDNPVFSQAIVHKKVRKQQNKKVQQKKETKQTKQTKDDKK